MLAIAVCALATHAAVYGSLMPSGGAHRYFAWYAPIITALSVLSLVGLPLALAIGVVAGRDSRVANTVASMFPARSREGAALTDVFRLASLALVFLAVQETLERSLSTGTLALASFSPSALLALVIALLIAASVVVLLEQAASSLVEAIARTARSATRAPEAARWRSGTSRLLRRIRPLAVHGGLRAPPVAL